MTEPNDQDDFTAAAGAPRHSQLSEFIGFLRAEKRYWLAPIIIVIVLLGLLISLSGTAAAPFIYTIF